MRRLLALGVLAVGVWWLLRRRCTAAAERATVGYDDGSSVTLDAGAPELERLLLIARGAVR
jgi:ferric-dicitrate binding protein FerR (iron transport regulator)